LFLNGLDIIGRQKVGRIKIPLFVEDAINNTAADDGVALSQTRDELSQLEVARDALYDEFVQKSEVLEAYVAACQQRGYYFSTQEIGFAAHLFDKRIVIYSHRHLNQVYGPMGFGDEDSEEVVIFHKGHHFSHCQRKEVAESDSNSA